MVIDDINPAMQILRKLVTQPPAVIEDNDALTGLGWNDFLLNFHGQSDFKVREAIIASDESNGALESLHDGVTTGESLSQTLILQLLEVLQVP